MLTVKSIKFPTLVRIQTVKFASNAPRAYSFNRFMMDLLVASHYEGHRIWPLLICVFTVFSEN